MRIITLCREYGAGGHSVGRKVAAELGIEFYDKDIIRGSAEQLGIDPRSWRRRRRRSQRENPSCRASPRFPMTRRTPCSGRRATSSFSSRPRVPA